MSFERIAEEIFQLKIPFENIYTSVFLLRSEQGNILFDGGNDARDVEEYILPALQEKKVVPDLLLCSHLHGDHCGGITRLLQIFQNVEVGLFEKNSPYARSRVLEDGELLFGRFRSLRLEGHCKDALAVWDEKTATLLTADCLQQQGVGRYGRLVEDEGAHLRSVERVRALKPRKIVASHDYRPCGGVAEGEEEIFRFLHECAGRDF